MEALTRLMKAADECRTLFDDAGLEYPAPLKRMLGLVEKPEPHTVSPSLVIPPPSGSGRPQGAAPDWLSIPVSAMSTAGLVRIVLSRADAPVPVRQIVHEIQDLQEGEVNPGSIANVGTRFERERVIERSEAGWALIDREAALILQGEHVWGAPERFLREELAGRRREAILHILAVVPGGLQQAQILAHLQSCDWLRLTVNKDMVKMDMLDLQRAKRVKRTSNRKWVRSDDAS